MKFGQIVIAGALSCSLGSLAFAQQEAPPQNAQGVPLQGAGPQAQEAIPGTQGQTGPNAAEKAEISGAHSPPESKVPESKVKDETLRRVQQKLNERGYRAGAADGVWGPQTKAAIEKFQQAKGIGGDGEINPQTLAALGVQSDDQASGAAGGTPEGGGAGTGAVDKPRDDAGQPSGQEKQPEPPRS